MRHLNANYIKKWRKARGLSASDLGRALGYRGRETVAHIESGNLEITERFATRFENFKNQTQQREYKTRKIETKFALPSRIKILARPHKCKHCNEWFIFPNASDRVCTGRECRAAERRANKRKES